MKNRIIKISYIMLFFMMIGITVHAQENEVENDFQARTKVKLSVKPTKKIKLSFTPQLRFKSDFSVDEFLLEGNIQYKPIKLLALDAEYRFVGNIREKKGNEYLNRYAFSATLKKKFSNLVPSFRLQYTNYADDEITDKNFFRYKAALGYDIPNNKITPFVSAEAFQQINDGDLYKMRYSVGLDYKLFKKNYIGASYKIDYYLNEYRNRHIVSLGYKIKF